MRYPINPTALVFIGVILTAYVSVFGQPASAQIMTEPGAELLKSIDATRAMFADAYSRQDATMLSALYHQNAVFAGTLHPYWMEGRENIQKLWIYYFGIVKNAKIVFWSSSLRVLAPNTVVAQNATATMVMPSPSGQIHNVHMRLTIIWVRVPPYVVGTKSLEWQIAHMHGSEAPLFR